LWPDCPQDFWRFEESSSADIQTEILSLGRHLECHKFEANVSEKRTKSDNEQPTDKKFNEDDETGEVI
jgi:hypothetical protein